MYRYVFKRCKDAVEYGINVRKSFACHKTINNKAQVNENQQFHQNNNNNNSVLKYQEVNFLIPQQRFNYEEFKKKYHCKHPFNINPFLHALTWSTALIAGFYASQLICLYRRNKHFDPKKCFYTRYLQHKNKLLHRKLLCNKQAQTTTRSLVPISLKFTCPFKKNSEQTKKEDYVKADEKSSNDDELKEFFDEVTRLNLFDKRFEKFFKVDDDVTIGGHRKVFYTVNNDDTLTKSKDNKEAKSASLSNVQENKVERQQTEDEAIDEILSNLSEMIGELEFQMGVDCVLHGNYEEAVEHFRMSSSANNASSCFNLALLYEQGLGVKKDLEIALRLYKMASDQGHDKALYNLGVYFARGLGGVKRSTKKAKSYFEKAALHGNLDAQEALSLLLLEKKKLSIVPDDFIVADDVGRVDILMGKNISYNKNLQSIAVT